MLEFSGSPSGPSNAEPAPSARVVAFVLSVEGEPLTETVLALESQVYELSSIVVIGGGDPAIQAAADLGVEHLGSTADAVRQLDQSHDLVWFVHGDAIPRPDALGALVFELERNDASMVGSKILDAEHPDRLESVGAATDVFGEPYTGLDPDEVDLEQYDVVRDVSFVSGVSVLIRRDLLRGLRGIDTVLPPVAAGMDLSQRARIAGGRVMVVPSSEVLHRRSCGHDVAGWRELAGRMRAMGKAYRLLTLLWVVPVGALLGLLDGIVRLFLGAGRPLVDFVRALAWNLGRGLSTLSARSQLRRVRQARDEELFRYQVSGSLRLRQLFNDLGERFGWIIDEDEGLLTEEEMADDATAAGPVLAGATLVALGLAARALWFGGLPAVGFSLPNHPDLVSVIGSWAGGWNPAGLGSSEATHPSVALSAAADWVLAGWSGGRSALSIAFMVLGVLALGRLLRRLRVEGPSRHLAGLVLFLGAGAGAVASSTDWSGLIAIGPAVWLLDILLRPWPTGLRSRIGLLAALAVAAVVTAFAAPLLPFVVAALALLAWPIVDGVRASTVTRAVAAAVFAALSIAPYLLQVAPAALFERGPEVTTDLRSLGWLAVMVAALLAVVSVVGRQWRLVVWGTLVGLAPPLVLAATDWVGDVAVALAAVSAIGSAMVVGVALGFDDRGNRAVVVVRGVGVAVAFLAVVFSLGSIVTGRAGLPEDEWTNQLEFVSSLTAEGGISRVLLIGEPDRLPGEARLTELHGYRVINGEMPTIDQARLPRPRPSDEALARTVDEIISGGVVRPGELLAPFAVRWVVVVGDVPVLANLVTQVDLVPVPVAEGFSVFRNESFRPRAEASDGTAWTAGRTSATGPESTATVRWAETASGRWGPGWSQSDWFNVVSGESGEIHYTPDPTLRLLAWLSLGLVAFASIIAVWGRERR